VNRPAPSLSVARMSLPVLLALACLAAGVARSFGASPADTTPPHRRASVHDSPGWKPLVDPESSAVTLGRRTNAPRVAMNFSNGAKSMDDLGRRICRAMQVERRDSLQKLCVTDMEFKTILWPEFPQSRPVTGVQWDDAWKILYARMNAGCGHAVRDYGGHWYQFIRFESADPVQEFRNFKMHSNLVLVAKDDMGQVQRMKWLRGVVERRGSFKIYSTED
jgi:hypothetical protein